MVGPYILLSLVLLSPPRSQSPSATGVIYGTVVDQDGGPARKIGLTATPLGVPLGAILPHTKTDQQGRFRLAVPWWRRYTVFAEDEEAGYSQFSTGPSGDRTIKEVTLSPDQPQVQFDLALPPKAGFLQIRLTSRRSGAAIEDVQVSVMSSGDPRRLIFSQSCSSARSILLPPNKDLLLHVISPGFREWSKSLGNGAPINVRSGTRILLDVQLDPSD